MKKSESESSGHSFKDYFKRAINQMLVLVLLSEKPMYVYQLASELEKRSSDSYSVALLYPVLYRLVKLGYAAESETIIGSQTPDVNTYRRFCRNTMRCWRPSAKSGSTNRNRKCQA